jgi:hypothetical protein
LDAVRENAIYAVEMLPGNKADVRVFASETSTPKNLGFAPTMGQPLDHFLSVGARRAVR